jgi:hypothetical protein
MFEKGRRNSMYLRQKGSIFLTYRGFCVHTKALELYLAWFPDTELVVMLAISSPIAVVELGWDWA